eukprot:354921-Rhodomonas_salina.1
MPTPYLSLTVPPMQYHASCLENISTGIRKGGLGGGRVGGDRGGKGRRDGGTETEGRRDGGTEGAREKGS